MKTIFYSEKGRGNVDHGWLKAKHSFSFGSFYDSNLMGFGQLLVINDDIIAPAKGFGTHPHDNMEIITIPLKGALAHKDSMGHEEVIHTGEVQVMSAGSGITHSEYNASETEAVNLFQIWIKTKSENIKPSYDQKNFNHSDERNRWVELVGPDNKDGRLAINQDAYISILHNDSQNDYSYKVSSSSHGVYFLIVDGEVRIASNELGRRDAIAVWDTQEVKLDVSSGATLLAIEVPL